MSLKKFIISSCALLVLAVLSQSAIASTATFMVVADIHFDPFTTCGTEATCPLIQKLENTPASGWQPILAATVTSRQQYKQDTNYVLLNSSLQAMQATALETHPQFIIVLGDLLAHKYDEKYKKYSADKSTAGYQEFVKKTMTFLASELKNKFPDTDIYVTMGNNDSYSGDNVSEPNGAFFHDMSELWGSPIINPGSRSQVQKDFSTAGYYALDIPQQPAIRLIVLNSNLFSPYAKTADGTATLELDWFEQQLKQARLHNQQVLIAMHIPVGIDVFASLKHYPFKIVEMWKPEYTQRFQDDLENYSANITGILAGHLHSDYFQVIETKSGAKIPMSNTPSISPFNGNNPGFKVYTYHTESLVLRDYTTFYTSLPSLEWRQEYNFNAIYQRGNADRALVEGFEHLTAEGELANAYQLYYDTTSNTDPIHHSYNPYYWCQLKAITAADYQTCMATQ